MHLDFLVQMSYAGFYRLFLYVAVSDVNMCVFYGAAA